MGTTTFVKSFYYFVHYYGVPCLFVGTLPFYGIMMALYPLEDGGLSKFRLTILLGNRVSWTFVAVITTWGIAFLKLPGFKTFRGPTTAFGFTPTYSANGFTYYVCTLLVFLSLAYARPAMCSTIYHNMPEILGSWVVLALLLCVYLWWKGKYYPECGEKPQQDVPLIFEFYRGMDVHPRLLGMDVKQLTNCRVGMILWLVLPLAFLVTAYEKHGFNSGLLVNVLLQAIYIGKFYWWETGYFNTLDMALDRAGFYICWGCLAFIPSFYTYSTYYFVSHAPRVGHAVSAIFFVLGILFIYFNYQVDHQKQRFRGARGGCKIWGRKAEYIEAKYQTEDGNIRTSKLLTSGYWGVARHPNYVFELLLALFWNLPGLGLGFWPFAYNVYLTVLLVHRTYRDEHKCSRKYGVYWKKYCKMVPYRFIPNVY